MAETFLKKNRAANQAAEKLAKEKLANNTVEVDELGELLNDPDLGFQKLPNNKGYQLTESQFSELADDLEGRIRAKGLGLKPSEVPYDCIATGEKLLSNPDKNGERNLSVVVNYTKPDGTSKVFSIQESDIDFAKSVIEGTPLKVYAYMGGGGWVNGYIQR